MKKLLRLCLLFTAFAGLAWAQSLTYVVVHGATAGGWEWKTTANVLEADGHTVHRATLTGLGERIHLANPGIDLETHINDVVNLILFEDLHDIVLTGHSYGGMVITGVMDRIPERIRHVIFFDAAVPDDGMSLYDLFGGPRADANVVDGMLQVPWVKPDTPPPHSAPQSVKTFSAPVSYQNPDALALPVTYVAFVPADQSTEERAQRDGSWQRAAARGWTIRTFPGSHVAMVEDPRGVATLMQTAVTDQNQSTGTETTSRSEIRIRDPFVLPDAEAGIYYIYGTTTSGIFDGGVERKAVMVFQTQDLQNWEDPVPVWEIPKDHWGRETVWAPEVHRYNGRYYLFATVTSDQTLPTPAGRPQNVMRGTEILVADSPLGPFEPVGDGPQTPPDWMALDGSLWIEDGVPYMVFCHEWAQIVDGSFDIVRMSEDLSEPVGEPTTLFHASAGPWVRCRGDIGELYQGKRYHAYVSDGNWLHYTKDGTLLMLWSSYGPTKYAVGISRSLSGSVFGPWEHLPDPLWSDDGGHPMLFNTFDGRLVMVIHQPNRKVERARFFEIEDLGDTLRLKAELITP